MIHEDWLIRQITTMVQAIARILFGKQTPVYEVCDELVRPRSDLLHQSLVALLHEGRVNEAENLLFDSVEVNDLNDLQVAVDFYSRLNRWDDDALERHGFSREEIREGLDEIMRLFDADDLNM